MGLRVLADWNLQLKPMREFPPGITDSREPRPSGSRLGRRLRWIGAAAAIGGSLVWLAVGDDKGMAILSGVMAIVLGRVLLGGQTTDPEGSDTDQHGSTSD
jgi:hypothetical protein